MDDEDQLMTVREVADLLRLNVRTIKRWIADGKLHGLWLGSDRAGWRVRRSEVKLLLEGGQHTRQLPLPGPERPKLAA